MKELCVFACALVVVVVVVVVVLVLRVVVDSFDAMVMYV